MSQILRNTRYIIIYDKSKETLQTLIPFIVDCLGALKGWKREVTKRTTSM